jgi:hypothetical protein
VSSSFTVLSDQALRAYVLGRSAQVNTAHRLASDERGEGVISAAIAVLIMAFLGAAMWIAFKGIFDNASAKTSDQVNQIGG